ncbi:MAG: transcription elongation factor GreA [Candidatus Daviesbacteria bacterium]|nr:transcription elongation factor GreA [Candidatus Daviesbacteria bacterium]
MAKLDRSAKISKKVYLTPQGLQDAKIELDYLKNEKRAQVAERIQGARDFGDVSENSEYDSALEEQTLVENRIAYLEDAIGNAQLIEGALSCETVVIGSVVKVRMDDGVDEYTIVGKVEANPSKKKISNESPVGSALLGAKIGEEVVICTPDSSYKAKVLQIK